MDQSDQMDAMFKSSRTDEIDPVSGNEVPTGSLPEEVRDDIPAQLSEGEYVVPADVVRYFGVKFFEDIRTKAKQGFQDMEANGRIGGEPIGGMEMGGDELPFDISELQVADDGQPEQPMMNEGGLTRGYNPGGDVVKPVTEMNEPDWLQGYNSNVNNYAPDEYKTYVNAEGLTMSIRFVNGKPVSPIPTGYTLQGSAVEEAAPVVSSGGSDDSTPAPDVEPKPETDWTKASLGEYEKAMDQRDSLLMKGLTAGAGLINPVLGLAARQSVHTKNWNMMKGLEEKLKDESLGKDERTKLEGYYSTLVKDREDVDKDTRSGLVEKSGIFGGQSTMRENLRDTNKDGKVNFGDTWLGDTLGFDGKVGNQGASMKASMAGDRRNDSGGSSNNASTPKASSGGKNNFFQNVANTFTPNDGKSYVGGSLKDDDEDK